MNTENTMKIKRKSPKFKEIHDEDMCWEEKIEIQSLKKKLGKKFKQRTGQTREKW